MSVEEGGAARDARTNGALVRSLPASPNWFCSSIASCSAITGRLVYGANNQLVVMSIQVTPHINDSNIASLTTNLAQSHYLS